MRQISAFSLNRVSDLHSLTVAPETPLPEAICRISQTSMACSLALDKAKRDQQSLSQQHSGCVVVLDNSQLAGILTERDIVRLVAAHQSQPELVVKDVMSQQVITLRAEENLDVLSTLDLMRHHHIRHLPLVDQQGQILRLLTPCQLREFLEPCEIMKLRRVQEAMNVSVIYASLSDSVFQIAQIMSCHQVSRVVIVEPIDESALTHKPVGIITERDIVQCHCLELNLERTLAAEVMSTPLFTVNPADSLWAAHQMMQRYHVQQLVVADNQGSLQGLVTQSHLLPVDPVEMYTMLGQLQQRHQNLENLVHERTTKLQQQEEMLHNLALGVAAETGGNFFRSLVSALSKALKVDFAFIGEVQEPLHRIRTLANYGDGQEIVNFEYDLAETPSEKVVAKEVCLYPSKVQQLFPQDPLLRHYQAEGYLGTPLINTAGEVIGLLCIMSRYPLPDPKLMTEILQAFAARAAGELERQIEEVEHQRFLKASLDLHCIAGFDGYFKTLNPCFVRILGYSTSELLAQPFLNFIHPEDRDATVRELEQLATGTNTLAFENRYRCRDGSYRWFLWSATPYLQQQMIYASARDITERKRAEAANQESQQRLNSILGSLEDAVWSIKADSFELLYLSPATEEIYRRPISEFSDNSQLWLQVVHPGDQQKVRGFFERILEAGGQAIEYRIVRPDGAIRWLLNRGWVVWDANGEALRLDGLVSDITDRKQNEEKLLQQADLLNLAHDAIMVRDLEGTICFWNQGAAVMYGWTSSEAVGKNLHQLLQTQFPANQDKIMADLLREGHWDGELTHIRRDGTTAIVLCRWSLQRDEADSPTRILEINHDITERKRVLQIAQEHAALLDVATDAILVRGLDSRILFWNRGAEALYGWTRDEAMGKNANLLLYPHSPSPVDDDQPSLFIQGKWSGERQQITKTGEPITVMSRWTLVKDKQSQPKFILTVNTDITQHKQLEHQFLRTQRLESIGTLTSGIAHDLNNILTPIYGVAQLLPLQLPDANKHIQHQFEILQDCAKRGTKIIDQMLSFSKGVEGERTTLGMQHVIAEMLHFVHNTFPKSIQISTNVSEDLWSVRGDATQIDQVFMNLFINARDAMPEGGNLGISATNLMLDQTYAACHIDAHIGPYILLTITDTGIGISEDQLEHIFEPFFTTKSPEEGTGLGLFTVHNIIQSHGGFIAAYSELGKGTQFKVYLPAIGAADVAECEGLDLPSGHGELILVVDDEASICEVAQQVLENHNYRVLIALDGIDAIAKYTEHQTDIKVVLMDMTMPTIDGALTIQIMQKINSNLKAIVVSGLPGNEEIAPIIRESVKAFLKKPYSTAILLTTLQDVLEM